MKVLVVDDDPLTQRVVAASVTSAGHEAVLSDDGEDAWRRFLGEHIDVVITDRSMPGLEGLELCRRVRASGLHYAYVIIVTGADAVGAILAGMEAGADEYLVKPVSPSMLQARLVAAERVTALYAQLAESRAELERVNHELEVLARVDALTGLGNRLRLREDLEALEAAMARYGRRECMVVLDVDWFKGYNDTHGHQAGDAALMAIARVIENSLRRDDRPYRYGGEEFLLLLPEQSAESGRIVAERVRKAVEGLGLAGERPLTLSAGVAAGGRELGPDRLLSLADEALYRAKERGRNRVELAGGPNSAVTDSARG